MQFYSEKYHIEITDMKQPLLVLCAKVQGRQSCFQQRGQLKPDETCLETLYLSVLFLSVLETCRMVGLNDRMGAKAMYVSKKLAKFGITAPGRTLSKF